MSDLRTPEVNDLLRVFATLDDEDTIYALLEDLFTIREIKETSQRLAVARLLAAGKSYTAIEEATGSIGHHHSPRVEVPLLRQRRLRLRLGSVGCTGGRQ